MTDQPGSVSTGDVKSAEKKSGDSISRREFARRAALASAVASIAPTAAVTAPGIPGSGDRRTTTQDPPPPAPPASVAPQNPLPNAPKLSPESQSEADGRFQAILVLYGSRFSAEQKNDLHRLCAVVQPALDHIRAYRIENGDGPALYLKPQYEREKKPMVVVAPAKAPVGQSTKPAKSAATSSTSKKP
jgi:hypothetical protein